MELETPHPNLDHNFLVTGPVTRRLFGHREGSLEVHPCTFASSTRRHETFPFCLELTAVD
jgi:hypothetical protein